MTEHAVVIAGGGPTGMMLAGELALAGIDVVVVERRATQELDSTRARGLHSRTIEVLDQRGIADRFLAEGQAVQIQSFARIPLDISDFPTRHNYGLALLQIYVERILAAWVSELGVPIAREREVTGFAQDDSGVDLELSDGQSLRADYLVGCDGGRSVIRKAAGIEFPGWDPTTSWIIAEVEMKQQPEFGMREGGGIGPVEDTGRVGVALKERQVEHVGEPTVQDLREALIAADGTDYGVHSPTFISRFTDMTRQAASYRKGRVLLAGDAAHVHPPQGGQGLNTGVQDAVNLGWKLAQVVNGTSPDRLLDTYHAERHPVGARVLHYSMAQIALSGSDARTDALHDTVRELLSMDEPRKRFAAMVCGLDIRYDLGEGHPLLGRRIPDLDLETTDGLTRVFTLLHEAKPVLLNLGQSGGFDISPWANRVRLVDATHDGVWELPVIGEIPAPPAVLIRPDGHVAWAGDLTDPELPRALATWFGVSGRDSSRDLSNSRRTFAELLTKNARFRLTIDMTNAEKFNIPSADAALLEWSICGADSSVEISLAGEFDLAAAEPFAEMVREVLEKSPSEIVVRMADVSFLDSTGIRCLITAVEWASEIECRLVVRDPSRPVSRVLHLCGVEELLLFGAESDSALGR